MINATIKDYWSKDKWAAVDWAVMQKHWPLATDEAKPDTAYSICGPCRITYDEANALLAAGVGLELTPLPGAMLTKMTDDHLWEYGTRTNGKDLQEGNAVQIAVPDMALLYIDEVQVETDCCTDALQGLLDEGWRILAVCPPNSARRPDYIIGRRKVKDPFDAR